MSRINSPDGARFCDVLSKKYSIDRRKRTLRAASVNGTRFNLAENKLCFSTRTFFKRLWRGREGLAPLFLGHTLQVFLQSEHCLRLLPNLYIFARQQAEFSCCVYIHENYPRKQ